MVKVKYVIIAILTVLILLLIPNISKAASVTRNIGTASTYIEFDFTGLTLDTNKEYEYKFTKERDTEVDDREWTLLDRLTATTATVKLQTSISKVKEIINTSDNGYISIRERETKKEILNPQQVDLKIPYLYVTDYAVLKNGKEFIGQTKSENISIQIRDKWANKNSAFYQYEKITDTNLINKYKEIKEKNGNFLELQNLIRNTLPTNQNWNEWAYFGGGVPAIDGGYGKPQRTIEAPDKGLYYMWVKFTGEGHKDLYGVILVDNLEDTIPLEEISIQEKLTLRVGLKYKLSAVFTPSGATNKKITWSSSDETIATVDNNGTITAIKEGQATIAVVAEDGNKKATCMLTVIPAENSEDNKNEENKNDTNKDNANNENKEQNNNDKEDDNTKNNEQDKKEEGDNTTIKDVLPQTGVSMAVVIGGIVMALVAVICNIRYKKYRE